METTDAKQDRSKTNGKRGLRALQARIDELEEGARERLLRALGAGQHRLSELDVALERMTHEDWTVEGMKRRLETLRRQAESLRATALRRVNEIPATAMNALAAGTRVPVQNLARELERLARLVEPHHASPPETVEAEVIPAEPRPPRARVEG